MEHGKYSGVVDIALNGIDEVIRLRDDNERLKREIFRAKERAAEWRMKAKTSVARAQYLEARCVAMDAAIRCALADSESGNGWGPDVTVCGYLRATLGHNAELTGGAKRRPG